jgi:hypothetical protein
MPHEEASVMPADYTIHIERQLVYSRLWGDVADADLFEHQRRLALDPVFHRDLHQLIDLIGVTNYDGVTTRGIQNAAQRHLYGPHSRRAIVAPDTTTFGLARMFETYRDIAGGEERIRVVRNFEDAWAWLGVSPRDA